MKVHPAEQYALDVESGNIPACKWIRLACERYFRDMDRLMENSMRFDSRSAQRVINFFERILRHYQGKWAGKPFLLAPWEQFVIWNLYGFQKPDGTRRFSQVSIFIPRKNGKTELAAGCGLFAMGFDGENAAEVYSTATDKDQAKIAFVKAKEMLKQSSHLLEYMDPLANAIAGTRFASTFKPWSSDTGKKDGYNPSFAIVDEYHAHPDNAMMDVIKSGLGARTQPIVFMITTAGFNTQSPAYKHQEVCQNVLEGKINQEDLFTLIYTVDEGDDISDPEIWRKANPSWDFIDTIPAYMARRYNECQNSGDMVDFKTKNLNVWTKALKVWVEDADWTALEEEYTREDLIGEICYAGLDLSDSYDLTALALYFPDQAKFLWYYWIPEQKLLKNDNSDGINYREWVNDGYITVTPGNVIDYEYIRKEITGYHVDGGTVKWDDDSITSNFDLQSIAYDRWGATQIAINMTNDGAKVSKFGQGYTSMSYPTKEFKKMILGKEFAHDGNPVTRWMLSNVNIAMDAAGNIKVDKAKSRDKIDGIVASIMALGEYLTEIENNPYSSRGVITI
jgi:phage terminase large subunit-like protein